MRRVSLAARRAHLFLRKPPQPWWLRPALSAAGIMVMLGVVLGAHAWLVASGTLAQASSVLRERLHEISGDVGFTVERVVVQGRVRTEPTALAEAIALERGMALLAVDPAYTRTRVEMLHWVERASVARRWPDTVAVRLLERRPLALWQRNRTFALIDQSGAVIEGAASENYRHLRVVVGEHAPKAAADLFALLSSEPRIGARVSAATRIGERRWSLFLDNGIEVLLPETGEQQAVRFLAAEAERKALLERAISVIDLRHLPDRMRLQLAPEMVEPGAGEAA